VGGRYNEEPKVMRKNLIIDGQVLQTDAWHRGMGKYTLQLLQELSTLNASELSISVLFNDNIKCDKSRFEVIKLACPNILQVKGSLPLARNKTTTKQQYTKELDNIVAKNFKNFDNHFLITSLFTFDFFAEYPSSCRKILLFYDLTPLLFWKDLGGYFPPDMYMKRFEQILESELILSISETTRKDLLATFGLPPEKIVNIDGGFSGLAKKGKKPKDFVVPKDFVLFPTGDLPHKNNEVAVRGFNKYIQKYHKPLKILITSTFSEKSQQQLHEKCQNIVFTGNVTDEELNWLYQNARAVLFASKYEGLGIPILDAVINAKPVIATNIPVFKEMTSNAYYYFEPDNIDTLFKALDDAISAKESTQKQKDYPKIIKKYTWENTGKTFLKTVLNYQFSASGLRRSSNPRIAIASIHPGAPLNGPRLSEQIYCNLKDDYEVDFFFDANGYHYKDMDRPTFLDYFDNCSVFDIDKLNLDTYKDYKAIIYILDKMAIPSRVAQRACVLPGYLIWKKEKSEFKDHRTSLLFSELIQDNQKSVFYIRQHSIEESAAWIKTQVETQKDNYYERIIREGSTNTGIIKKLLRVTQNDA
jgi:glycosyltransferase involved in cell wall biosynthesis